LQNPPQAGDIIIDLVVGQAIRQRRTSYARGAQVQQWRESIFPVRLYLLVSVIVFRAADQE